MNYFYSMRGGLLLNLLLLVLFVWTVLWKCYSVWLAAKHGHKKWFVALLILNTIGILDMIYVFSVLNKKWSDVDKDFKRVFKNKLK